MNRIVLLTYPRHGSHKLFFALEQQTDLIVFKTHSFEDIKETDFVITILRNPLDTIISQITLEKFLNAQMSEENRESHNLNIKDDDKNIAIDKATEFCKTQYINFYNLIAERADLVVDYRDLVEDVESIVQLICDRLDMTKNDVVFDESKIVWQNSSLDQDIFKSVKNSEHYEAVKSFVIEQDLLDAVNIYEKLLPKSI